jgi:competence protein ComGC
MKQDFYRPKRVSESALTLVEVLVILVVVVVLLALLLPQLARVFHRSATATCVDNLKQVGLAFRTWSTDSSDDFPMKRSTKRGGSAEFVLGGNPDRHFFCLSNELMTTKVLVCPSDSRQPATSFLSLISSNVSYFVGVDA